MKVSLRCNHCALGIEKVEKKLELGGFIAGYALILGQILNYRSTLIMGRREYVLFNRYFLPKEKFL
jgi:hypothetical protein